MPPPPPPQKKKKKKKRSSRFSGLCSDQQLSFCTLLDRASFPHYTCYNNIKIIKFGWELFILWVISYGLSFSGFARFAEFPDTINDSFSSTCANTYQHSTSYKEISVPMTCLDRKSLSLNCIVIIVRQYTYHWTQYSLSGRPKLSLILPRFRKLKKNSNSVRNVVYSVSDFIYESK